MICVRCNKEIKKKENYFEVNEYSKNKIIDTKYLHKKCHEKIEMQKKIPEEFLKGSLNILGGLMNQLKQEGILTGEKHYEILG